MGEPVDYGELGACLAWSRGLPPSASARRITPPGSTTPRPIPARLAARYDLRRMADEAPELPARRGRSPHDLGTRLGRTALRAQLARLAKPQVTAAASSSDAVQAGRPGRGRCRAR